MYRKYKIDPAALQRARAISGMNAVDVSDEVGIPYGRYMSYETGGALSAEKPTIEAIAEVLVVHPSSFSPDYEWEEPTVTRVYPRVDMIRAYLREHNLTANQFAIKAGVYQGVIYGFVNRGRMACKASTASKIAVNGLEVEPGEFCEAFWHYQPEGVEQNSVG
jgi:hypothetical protein